MVRKKIATISDAGHVSGRDPKRCAFCGQKSWAGRTDINGLFLCEPCCQRGERILKEQSSRRRAERWTLGFLEDSSSVR